MSGGQLLAHGPSVCSVSEALRDESGRRLPRTAVLLIGERLRANCQEFAGRNLSEYDIAYLFVDGIAERIRSGQKAVMKFMFGATIRAVERWRSIPPPSSRPAGGAKSLFRQAPSLCARQANRHEARDRRDGGPVIAARAAVRHCAI